VVKKSGKKVFFCGHDFQMIIRMNDCTILYTIDENFLKSWFLIAESRNLHEEVLVFIIWSKANHPRVSLA